MDQPIIGATVTSCSLFSQLIGTTPAGTPETFSLSAFASAASASTSRPGLGFPSTSW